MEKIKSKVKENEKKQELLFLSRTLGRAGVGVSLVSVLKHIDYTKFNVTIGIQFPIKDLENELPKEVKVVYYGEITSKLYKKIFDFNIKLGNKKNNPIIRFFWHLLNKLEDIRMSYKVKKCFKKKYDTVNAYHQGVASKFAIKRIRAKKKILWYHSEIIQFSWYKKIFPKADIIVASTEKGKSVMVEAWGEKVNSKIIVLPCLMPFDTMTEKSKMKMDVDIKKGESQLLMTCGRLSREKGIDLAIEAAGIIKNQFKNFSWIIVGDGPEKAKLQAQIEKLGLEDNVKLVGFCDNPYPYFKECDIYVSPSRLECYGLTIVEALFFNKPVVTTKTIGGTTTIINRVNGVHAEIEAQSLAQGVLTLLKDKELYKQIKANVMATDYVGIQNERVKTLNQMEVYK